MADVTSVHELYEEENGPLLFMTKEGKLLADLVEKVHKLTESTTSILTVLNAVLTRLPLHEYDREGSPEINSPEMYDCSLLDVPDEEEEGNNDQHFDLHGIDPLHVNTEAVADNDPIADFHELDPLHENIQVGSPYGPYII